VGSLKRHRRGNPCDERREAVNAVGYLTSLRAFFDLDTGSLAVADLNEILLGMTKQNTRRRTVIALKSLVSSPQRFPHPGASRSAPGVPPTR
jgi:hypothetical protein